MEFLPRGTELWAGVLLLAVAASPFFWEADSVQEGGANLLTDFSCLFFFFLVCG